MDAWEEHLVHPHLPCTLPGHLRRAGFRVTRRHLIPLFNPRYEQNTISALNMGMIARFVVGRRGLTEEDVDAWMADLRRSEEHTSELQSRQYLVCRLLLEKQKNS